MPTSFLKSRAYQRKRKRDLFAKGLCVWCGKTPPVEGRMRCEPCRKIGRESARKHQAKRRAAAKVFGLCRSCCLREAMPRRSQCAVCAEARIRFWLEAGVRGLELLPTAPAEETFDHLPLFQEGA